MPEPMVTARDVARHYGPVRAVDGVNLTVTAGQLFGLIGHNGAGKSTLFRMLLGLERPTRGEIHINGVPASGPAFRQVRRSVGYLPETVVLYDNLTGAETLGFYARLKSVPASACRPTLARVGLDHAATRRVGTYSKGMRQRLGMAQALLGQPRLLFLDEPTTGLDPEAVRSFYALLRELKHEGVTVILTSHSLAEIQERVDQLAIMVAGRVRAEGTVQQLRERVNLPLTLRMTVRPGAMADLRARLETLPVTDLEATGDVLRLRCDRSHKMTVLAALAARREEMVDIDVHEPSLEDVFFGVAE